MPKNPPGYEGGSEYGLVQAVFNVIGGACGNSCNADVAHGYSATLDGKVVQRSRTAGFGYAASANTLTFINVKYAEGSVVIASSNLYLM